MTMVIAPWALWLSLATAVLLPVGCGWWWRRARVLAAANKGLEEKSWKLEEALKTASEALAASEQRAAWWSDRIAYFVQKQFPSHIEHLKSQSLSAGAGAGRTAQTPIGGAPVDSLESHLGSVAAQVSELATVMTDRAETAAKAAVQAVVRSLNLGLAEQHRAIDELQRQVDDPQVLGYAMTIDHSSGQLLRRVQSLGALAGMRWPGRSWPDSPLVDVVRAAVGRIRDFRRVDVDPSVQVMVRSGSIEPLVQVLAELLDNATRCSPPVTRVSVTFWEFEGQVGVVIDDEGIGLTPELRDEGRALLARTREVPISQLQFPPRIGWAAVGEIAYRHGLTVTADQQSPFGGLRAVVLIQSSLLVAGPDPFHAPAAAPSRSERGVPHGAAGGNAAESPYPQSAEGLPQRRRRRAATDLQPDLSPNKTPSREMGRAAGAFASRAVTPPRTKEH